MALEPERIADLEGGVADLFHGDDGEGSEDGWGDRYAHAFVNADDEVLLAQELDDNMLDVEPDDDDEEALVPAAEA